MVASFPTSNRAFTSKVDVTDTILADHVNALQEEVRAISTSLNGEPITTNVLTSTFTGTFSTTTTAWTNLSSRLLNIEAGLVNGVANAVYVKKAGGDTIQPASGTVALAVRQTAGTADLFQARDASNTVQFSIDYQGKPKVGAYAVLTTNDVTSGTISNLGTVVSGVWNATAIAAGYGGTGLTSYSVGDLIYASGATTLAKLADVATGNALISGGVNTAPAWGKIGLTTHVSGTLASGNGGTGLTTFTAANNAIYSTSASALTAGTLPTAAGGTGLTSFTSGGAVYATSTSALTTGTLPVTAGGTGTTTSTGTGDNVRGTGPTISGAILTGTPTAPTALTADNTTQIATTAFVKAQGYATIADPAFTGNPTAPTQAVDNNTTRIATTAYVVGQGYLKSATASSTYAPIASPGLSGTPTAPTAAVDTNTTQIATTAYVVGQGYAKLASPQLTGTPLAPTATMNTNTTQIATTAYAYGIEQYMTIALSDETTTITTGTAKLTWRAPFAMTLTKSPRLSLATAGTTQATVVNIKEAGTTIFSTKPQIDANGKTSVGSTVTPALSDTAIADDAEITFDVDQVGTGAKGLKVTIFYKRA